MAGVQTIPFTFAAPFGSVLASALAKKAKVAVVYLALSVAVLQTLGYALLAPLPSSTHLPASIYGFQFIAGFGCGINIPSLLVLVPFVVEQRDNGRLTLFYS
jgi:MFS family permease